MTLHAPPGNDGKEINIKLSRKDLMNLVMLRYGKRKRDLNKKKTR